MSDRSGRTSADRRAVLGAAAWILTVSYLIVQPIVASAWPVRYRWSVDYISDLGMVTCTPRVCSPLHGLMNTFFVLTGLLIVLGCLLLWPIKPRLRVATVAASFMMIGGLGTIVVGLVPEDVSLIIHSLAAAVHIPLQAVGLVLLGVALVIEHRSVSGVITLVFGVASLIGVALFFSGLSGRLGPGGSERLADYGFVGWFVLAGIVLIVRSAAGRRAISAA